VAIATLLKKSHVVCDLVILDIMMPELDGFQVLRKIRESSNVPVIMLSAKGKVADRVVGLELGADDYLAKPFEPKELLARIQSILRRTTSSNALVDIIHFEGLSLNKIKQEVLLDDNPINLSTAEMEALILFVDNPNVPLSRDFLVENLRGIEWQTCDRSVDVLVSRLRNKLGESPSKTRFIITVHGVGYRFVGEKKDI
jgi:DNA-binding response OmpR family regulator